MYHSTTGHFNLTGDRTVLTLKETFYTQLNLRSVTYQFAVSSIYAPYQILLNFVAFN